MEQPSYQAVCDNGTARKLDKNLSFSETELTLDSMDSIEEKAPEWLVTDYIPKYQITVMAGEGGSGKTSAWVALASSISSGTTSFMEETLPEDFITPKPGKVLFFSSEDSLEHTLKGRLVKNSAAVENIYSISLKDERFQNIKFNSPLLEGIIARYKPELVVFDPIQSFIPPDIQMGQRNAMRACLNPLIGLGEKYSTTFLIIVHANKQTGVYGRKRIADSSDIWDIARSVLLVGETQDKGIRYISHEKCNYGPTGQTVLFDLHDGKVNFKGYSDKKDRDYIGENDFNNRVKPQRDEVKEFIVDYLQDGEKLVSDLDTMAKAQSISTGTLQRAKTELKKEGKTTYYSRGYGEDKKHFIMLKDTSLIATK
jgi:RecA-family ATPase